MIEQTDIMKLKLVEGKADELNVLIADIRKNETDQKFNAIISIDFTK